MRIKDKFNKYFSERYLKDIYSEVVVFSRATGVDNLDQSSFWPQLNDHVEILSRKAKAGTYRFTKYKLKLISKGRGKVPREISIPTIRDRIALRAMCDFLSDIYKGTINFSLPQHVVSNVKSDISSGKYDACVKLDVTNFYPSIKHREMMLRLGKRIRDNDIKSLILSALESPTVSVSKIGDPPNIRGVPQGLAVSNILASLYLMNIDKSFGARSDIKYYRYVDDILILCSYSDANEVSRQVINRFSKVGLKIYDPIKNPEKSSVGRLSSGFNYLGYQFYGSKVTVRNPSIEKIKESLVSIFTSYKYSKSRSEDFLLWRLNLRITGCVFENKSKGWLFFFLEINDESLLHSLDSYVKKLTKRFGVSVKPKKFVRAYKELKHNKYATSYVPNFDKYTLDQMKGVLVNYFNMDLSRKEDEEIIYEFKRRLTKQVKDLQVDIKNFS